MRQCQRICLLKYYICTAVRTIRRPIDRKFGIFVPSKQSHVIFEFVNIYKDKGLFRFLKLSDSSDYRINFYLKSSSETSLLMSTSSNLKTISCGPTDCL